MIIGFVPNFNAHSLAELLGIYFSLWVKVKGTGAEVPFPGNKGAWIAKHNEAGADVTARQTIFLALHPETCGNGEAFNVASTLTWHTWEQKWADICAYFGLKGIPPNEHSKRVRDFIGEHVKEWDELEKEHGLKPGVAVSDMRQPGFEIGQLEISDFDRNFDMSKLREAGCEEECDTMGTWKPIFDRMRQAKIIP